jgi:phage terminase Nu1 subunit (DNA packaging protein)
MENDSNIVSAAVLGDWALMGLRRVRELSEAGIFVKAGRGRYDLKASIQGLIKHQRELAAGRVGIDPTTDITAANMRLKESSARLADLRYSREAGLLVAAADLKAAWAGIMRGVRQFVLSIPGAVAFSIPTLTATDRSIVERICSDGLTDCAMERGYDFTPDGNANGKAADGGEPGEAGEAVK